MKLMFVLNITMEKNAISLNLTLTWARVSEPADLPNSLQMWLGADSTQWAAVRHRDLRLRGPAGTSKTEYWCEEPRFCEAANLPYVKSKDWCCLGVRNPFSSYCLLVSKEIPENSPGMWYSGMWCSWRPKARISNNSCKHGADSTGRFPSSSSSSSSCLKGKDLENNWSVISYLKLLELFQSFFYHLLKTGITVSFSLFQNYRCTFGFYYLKVSSLFSRCCV